MNTIINIHEYLPSTITSREAINIISKNNNFIARKKYVINFNQIDFISRAFADELFAFIEAKNITASFTNVNSRVSEILNAVKKNRSKKNKSFHKIAVTPYFEKEELDAFLSLI